MTFEIQSITPGRSLESFQPSKYQIAGMRIDNPSGAWYRVVNNGRVIPPWTLGTQILLIPNATTVTVEFLERFAGQPSKLVGNPIQVMTTDEPLPDLAPISIANNIPYAQTFGFGLNFSLGSVADPIEGLFSIVRGSNVSRIRLASLAIWMTTPPVNDNFIELFPVGLESDSTASLLNPDSRDGDQLLDPECIVRDRWDGTTSPSIGSQLDYMALDVVGGGVHPQGPWHWTWNLDGPEMPPSASGSGGLASSGIGIIVSSSNPEDTDTYTYYAVYTEEFEPA